MPLGKEPTLIIGAIVAAANAVQIAAISMPSWLHTVIAVVSIAGGSVLNRSQVTPTVALTPNPLPAPVPVPPAPPPSVPPTQGV